MLPARPLNRLTLQWEPSLEAYDPTAFYQVFRLLLLVDGELLLDVYEQQYSFDLGELVRSLLNGGFYHILTCECGDAGCAGITEAVAVVHQAGYVDWHIASPLTRSLRFAYADYATAIYAAQRAFRQFLPQARTALWEGDARLFPDTFWHWPFTEHPDSA